MSLRIARENLSALRQIKNLSIEEIKGVHEMKNCTQCGTVRTPPTSKFCTTCGWKFPEGISTSSSASSSSNCVSCGKTVSGKFCTSCGEPVKLSNNVNPTVTTTKGNEFSFLFEIILVFFSVRYER